MKHRPFIWSPPALLLAALLAQPAAAAAPPALDCARAAQPMDTLVCRDPGLAALDRETTRLYGVARATLIGRRLEGLDETQRAWLLRRNDCRNAVDPRACVLAIQLDRIATLRQHHAVTRAPAERGTSRGPVAFDCGGAPLAATFVDGEPAMAHLRYRGVGYALLQTPSASGIRYAGAEGAALVGKGTEAAITLPDRTELTCRERGR
ncbi:hypothetical protein STVA_35610 [Allostella vacuolata]|nr:hypothetical protein STVA_35610 [Stella vacuolata]